MKSVGLSFVAILVAVLGLSSCASWESNNTTSLLSAAGFHTRTPETAKQVELFNSLPPYKLERRVIRGKVMYTYADTKRNLLYIGGEPEYQAFQRLGLKQQIALANLNAAQINQNNAMMWGAWGPGMGMWW